MPVQVKTSGLAVAAFVLGLLSLFTLSLTAVPAIILGIIALVAIEQSGGRLTGLAFAIIGIAVPMVSFILVLGVLLLPALSRARAQGMRAVCLSNTRQLSLVWIMYADDNGGRIVNGAAGGDRTSNGDVVEKAWIGKDWAAGYKTGERLPEQEQKSAITSGSLFPYCAAIQVYRCPAGLVGQLRTYAVVNAMNGVPREGTEGRGLYIKKMSEISRPSYRAVFIDQGWAAPESFPVHYAKAQWWREPPLTHRGATIVSFVDGHAETWQWEAPETLRIARRPGADYGEEHIAPETPEGKDELKRFQTAVWGQVGYTTGPWMTIMDTR
jgi:prepilin-type processing-associated H-X9-DG protein